MRTHLALCTLLAAGTIGCGSAAETPTATAPSELEFAMGVNPAPVRDAGLKSSSTLSVLVYEGSAGSQLTSAALTLLDPQGGVLTREALPEPLGFDPSGIARFRRTVSWAATDVVARQVNLRFTVTRADGTARSTDRTVDF